MEGWGKNMNKDIIVGFIRDLYFDNTEYRDKLIKDIDWDEIKSVTEKNKIQLLFYRYIYQLIPQEKRGLFDQMYFTLMAQNEILFREFLRINKLFEANKITFALVKGFPLSKMIYDDIYARVTSDLDILVAEQDVKRAYSCISLFGYKQQIFYDRKTKRLITLDSSQYKYGDSSHELQCIKSVSTDRYLGVEIKRATSAIPLKHIKSFLNALQKYTIENYTVDSFDLMHSYLHLCSNAYNNSETYMGAYRNTYIRDFLDIIMFVKKYKKIMSWGILKDLAAKYEISFKVYAVMIRCNELLGEKIVADDILEMFNPSTVIGKNYKASGYEIDWGISFLDRISNSEQRFIAVNNFIKNKVSQLDKYNEMPYIHGIVCNYQIEGSRWKLIFDFNNVDMKELCHHRIILLILNNFMHSEILFSDICINIMEDHISFAYCPISYIQNFENQYTELETIELAPGVLSISLDCEDFMFDNRLFIKFVDQKEIVDKFYARVMLSEGFKFDNHYIELK